jgi:hypothetical protein
MTVLIPHKDINVVFVIIRTFSHEAKLSWNSANHGQDKNNAQQRKKNSRKGLTLW